MGAVAAVIFFIVLFIFAFVGIALSIVGIIIFSKLSKKGKRFAKPLSVVSIVVLIISIILSLIPTFFFAFIAYVNTIPPEDFIETEIVIEENGYQDTKFTADGTIYHSLDLEVFDHSYIKEPIFSYKTSGFLNGSQCGNYYKVENANNYNLVCDYYGLLFAPEDEKQMVLNYYLEKSNQKWSYFVEDQIVLIDDAIATLLSNQIEQDDYELVEFSAGDLEIIELVKTSKDELILYDYHSLTIYDNKIYYVCSMMFEDEDVLYSAIELDNQVYEYFKAIN